MKFLSNEWIETAKNIASVKLDPEKDLKRITTSLLNIIENIPPNGKTAYFYISVNNGKICEMLINHKENLVVNKSEFVVIGNYDTFIQIFKGEMKTLVAQIKNRLIVRGDKVKALKFVNQIDRLISCL